jgi:hypothetical protein
MAFTINNDVNDSYDSPIYYYQEYKELKEKVDKTYRKKLKNKQAVASLVYLVNRHL